MPRILIRRCAAEGDFPHSIIQNRLPGITVKKRHRLPLAQFPFAIQLLLQKLQFIGKQIIENRRPHIRIRRIGKRITGICFPLQTERQPNGGTAATVQHLVRIFACPFFFQLKRDFFPEKSCARPGQQII